MKKKKLSILLNIATICLCVCAIAIGVYSVKNASLGVSGTINFTAHDCLVKVDVSMYGDAVVDGTPNPIGEPRASASARDLGSWDNSDSDVSTTLTTVTGDTGDDDTKKCYFSDMGTSGDVEDIVLVFKVTNNSDFPITASIKDVTGDNYKFTNANGMYFSGDTIIASLPAKDTTPSTATLQLKLNIKDTTKAPGDYTVALNFERTKETSLTVKAKSDFFYDASAVAARRDEGPGFRGYTISHITDDDKLATRNYVTMGTYNGTALRWYLFAKSNSETGAMEAVTDKIVENEQELPKGTYWFISEYTYDSIKFGTTAIYEGSGVQTYLTDETSTTETFFAKCGITTTTDSVYSKISGRIINDKVNGKYAECTTTKAQKLWLLSMDELDLLNGGYSVKSYNEDGSLYCFFKNILALKGENTSSLGGWWHRLYDAESNVVSYSVSIKGNIEPLSSCYEYSGVRPAFQITI